MAKGTASTRSWRLYAWDLKRILRITWPRESSETVLIPFRDRYWKESTNTERRWALEQQYIPLEQQIWNEASITELLGVNRRQLDYLRREKGFPCVRLGQRIRVYLANEVLDFVRKHSTRTS
jgi:hypothetical protein